MKAIVNLGTASYRNGQVRLKESLQGKTDADFFQFFSEGEVGAPKHDKNHYAFKVYAIDKVRSLGYDQIIWLDSSLFAIDSIEPIFNLMRYHGHFAEDSGNWCGNWCNDKSLEYTGYTRDEAMEIIMISSGLLGLNFNNPTTIKFYEDWKESMLDGQFNGDWDNNNKQESQDERCKGHRQDQSMASLYLHKHNMWINEGETRLTYATPEQEVHKSVIFKANGIL